MKYTWSNDRGRPLRAAAATAIVALLALAPTFARAQDAALGVVMSASPSGAATESISMRIPAEETAGTLPIFVRITGDSTLFGVEFGATPLVERGGVATVTPTFDPPQRTIPTGGALRRIEVKVAGLEALGTFTSTLYARLANRTQTLGTLSVVHTQRNADMQVAAIAPARATRQLPGGGTTVTLLVTVRNAGTADLVLDRPVIAALAASGGKRSQAQVPVVRVTKQDGRPGGETYSIPGGGRTTLTVELDDVRDTGSYAGALRFAARGHDPVEQAFAFRVKQGAALPVALIVGGVAIAYAIRRRYASGKINRAGQRRTVARLLDDLEPLRRGVRELEARESRILSTLERRLGDVADELALAGASRSADVLVEIDHKIDLLGDFVAARRHVRAMTPKSLQQQFEPQLEEAAAFLADNTSPRELEAAHAKFSALLGGIPERVEAAVLERFQRDVDAFLAEVEAGSAAAEALPLRLLKRISNARELAGAGRFTEARSELGGAQLAFARFLAEDLIARMPDEAAGPPGFVEGWPRFRRLTLENLKAVRRERRGPHAADAYRSVWQDYVVELASRLKSAASRDRRRSSEKRREQLVKVMEDCDATVAKALELDASAVDSYRLAVAGFVSPVGRKRSSAVAILEQAKLPPPVTVVAAGLGDNGRRSRPEPRAAASAAALTKQIRKRHFSAALVAAVVAVPAGLALLWAPNDTWGTMGDGASALLGGFGLYAIAAALDARRLGSKLGRSSVAAERKALAPASSST